MDATQWDARYAAATGWEWGAEPNQFVAAETADLPAGQALDLAAGEGRNAVWLAARGWRVTAVDFSAVALDKGRRLAEEHLTDEHDPSRIDWVRADLLDYHPTPAGYDLVLVIYLHLPAVQRRTVLTRAAEALAPGGTMLVVGHDLTNLTEGVGGPQDSQLLYRAEDVLTDLATRMDAGTLTVERAQRVARTVATDEGPRDALDALVRLRRAAD